jgi:FMN phosphatase YigB (HAD superfamily)
VFDWGHTLLDFTTGEEELLECYERVKTLLEAQAYRDVPAASDLVNDLSKRVEGIVHDSYERQELEELDLVELFDSTLRVLGYPLPGELVRQIVEMEHRALTGSLVMPESNLDVLRSLKEMGLKLGIVSNITFLPELFRADMDRFGIGEYVDEFVFSAAFGLRKPHPGIYRHVLELLSVTPAEAIFVGDRIHDDVWGAQQVGMRGVLTQEFRREDPEPGGTQPDCIISTLPELLPYVSRIRDETASVETASSPL